MTIRNHHRSLWRVTVLPVPCRTPLPTFRPVYLQPWAPMASTVVDCSTRSMSVCSSQMTVQEGCVFGGFIQNWRTLWKTNKLGTHHLLCLPAASCHRRHSDHLLVLCCAQRLQIITALTVLPPHFRCYHYHFHFCFWNIPGTTVLQILPSNWC